MKYTKISNSIEETRNLGKLLAKHLIAGDIILLYGDLGVGKSEFARGVARGLDIKSPVTSPSFTIMNAYNEGKLPFYHFDLYRIEDEEELYEIGIEEYIFGDGVSIIEWPERFPFLAKHAHLAVNISSLEDDSLREIQIKNINGFREIKI